MMPQDIATIHAYILSLEKAGINIPPEVACALNRLVNDISELEQAIDKLIENEILSKG